MEQTSLHDPETEKTFTGMPARFTARCLRIAPDFRSGSGQAALTALVLMGVFCLVGIYGFFAARPPVLGTGIAFVFGGIILLAIALTNKKKQLRQSAPLLCHRDKREVMLARWNEAAGEMEFKAFPWRAVTLGKVSSGLKLAYVRVWVIPLDPDQEREGWGRDALLPYTFAWETLVRYMDEDAVPFTPSPEEEKAYDRMAARQHPLPSAVEDWCR